MLFVARCCFCMLLLLLLMLFLLLLFFVVANFYVFAVIDISCSCYKLKMFLLLCSVAFVSCCYI
jgi:hypothetical protein